MALWITRHDSRLKILISSLGQAPCPPEEERCHKAVADTKKTQTGEQTLADAWLEYSGTLAHCNVPQNTADVHGYRSGQIHQEDPGWNFQTQNYTMPYLLNCR